MLVFDELVKIMRQLRDPQDGCPWDREQSLDSIVAHTLEEAYEVADAIDRNDLAGLRAELGDLLLQILFYTQITAEAGAFDIGDVLRSLRDKLIARHPHVFGNADRVFTAAEQSTLWETLKQSERGKAGGDSASQLDGVADALPALTRAAKLQGRAARVGFDWPDATGPMAKINEEYGELNAAINLRAGRKVIEEELGDILFAIVNLARHLEIDAEAALRTASKKFERRFRYVEGVVRQTGKTIDSVGLSMLDQLWEQAKQAGL